MLYTNPGPDGLDIPALGVRLEPGQSVELPDDASMPATIDVDAPIQAEQE